MPYLARPVTIDGSAERIGTIKTVLNLELSQFSPSRVRDPRDWAVPIMSRLKTKHAVLKSKPEYDAVFRHHGVDDASHLITQALLDNFKERYGNSELEARVIGLAQLGNTRAPSIKKHGGEKSTLVAILDDTTAEKVREQQSLFFDLVSEYSDATILMPDTSGQVAIATFQHNTLLPTEDFTKIRDALIGNLTLGPIKIF